MLLTHLTSNIIKNSVCISILCFLYLPVTVVSAATAAEAASGV